ncbi:hypothetical protein R1sor_001514 [Riccia sorocarpa]|uniref:Uncharacterized protein n=1 Tax=Riccia sorocarpa TaxID=122646 RepID=A0ABD3GW59_9MARC
MEFVLARENQETSELAGAAELRADMTRDTQPVDDSNLEDEIEELEYAAPDAAPDEENQGDVSESVAEDIPSIGRNEAYPNMNKCESAEASPSAGFASTDRTHAQSTSHANDAGKIASSNSAGKSVDIWRAHPNMDRNTRGLMLVLFQNAQKHKAEFKSALLAAKEKYRLGMLEEPKAAREEESKAWLVKKELDKENIKNIRLDRKNMMIFEQFKVGKNAYKI